MSRRARRAIGYRMFALALGAQVPASVHAQAPRGEYGPWSAGLAMGAGRIAVRTDLGRGGGRGTFLLGFRGSREVWERLRLGVELGGWLLEAFDVNDPSIGESVSVAGAFAQLYPWRATPLFVEAGFGFATYSNRAPDAFDTDGTGHAIGAGYAIGMRRPFWLTISAHASAGRFADVRNVLVTETGWRYGAFDLRLTGGARFGKPR
jgi:hypothetical protein